MAAHTYTITIPPLTHTYQAQLPADLLPLISRPGIQPGDVFDHRHIEKAGQDEQILWSAKSKYYVPVHLAIKF